MSLSLTSVVTSWCDDKNTFYCTDNQSCYTGVDGYIGCCSESRCMARTCIDYTPGLTTVCNYSTGGCIYCWDSASPYCATFTNVVASQHVNDCRATKVSSVLSYVNAITTGYIADYPSSRRASPASLTSFSPSPATSTGSAMPYRGTANVAVSESVTPPTATTPSSVMPEQTASSGTATTGSAKQSLPNRHTGPSTGAIVGIALGLVSAVVMFLLMKYFLTNPVTRRRVCCIKAGKTRRQQDWLAEDEAHDNGPVVEDIYTAEHEKSLPELEGDTTAIPRYSPYRISNPEAITPMSPAIGTGHSTPVGPDPLVIDFATRHSRPPPMSPISALSDYAEAPGDEPFRSGEAASPVETSAGRSPTYSYLPSSPEAARTVAREPCTPPKSPSRHRYVPYSPSFYTPSGQAPSSLPQQKPGRPRTPRVYTPTGAAPSSPVLIRSPGALSLPYSPSVYPTTDTDPPSSLPRINGAAGPPSLAQQYSLPELEDTSQRQGSMRSSSPGYERRSADETRGGRRASAMLKSVSSSDTCADR